MSRHQRPGTKSGIANGVILMPCMVQATEGTYIDRKSVGGLLANVLGESELLQVRYFNFLFSMGGEYM